MSGDIFGGPSMWQAESSEMPLTTLLCSREPSSPRHWYLLQDGGSQVRPWTGSFSIPWNLVRSSNHRDTGLHPDPLRGWGQQPVLSQALQWQVTLSLTTTVLGLSEYVGWDPTHPKCSQVLKVQNRRSIKASGLWDSTPSEFSISWTPFLVSEDTKGC